MTLTTMIAELEAAAAAWHKSLYREDMAEPFALLCYAYLPTLIEVVKRQGEALDEIAYGEIHTRENGKTFRCQMSGRAMQAKARSALTAHKEKSDVRAALRTLAGKE